MSPHDTTRVRQRALRRALRKRCPQCGVGGIFERYARVAPRCSECGLVFRREVGAQTGSMYLSAAVTQCFAVVLIGAVYVFTNWSVALSIGVVLPVVALFCWAFLPLSQALWVAIEYSTDAINHEAWVDPRP